MDTEDGASRDGRDQPYEASRPSQEGARLEIQDHLVARVSLAEAEARVHWPADLEDEPEPSAGMMDLTENWPAFRHAVRAGDEV